MIDPSEMLAALYPPEMEPDWESLDLDDERWYSFFESEYWDGEPGPCMYELCKRKRARNKYRGKRVCPWHDPIEVRSKEVLEIRRRRIEQLRNQRNTDYLYSPYQAEQKKSVYPQWRWEQPGDYAIPGVSDDIHKNVMLLINQLGLHRRDVYRITLEANANGQWLAVVDPVAKQERSHLRGGWRTTGIPYEFQIGTKHSRTIGVDPREIILEAVQVILRRSVEPIWQSEIERRHRETIDIAMRQPAIGKTQ